MLVTNLYQWDAASAKYLVSGNVTRHTDEIVYRISGQVRTFPSQEGRRARVLRVPHRPWVAAMDMDLHTLDCKVEGASLGV